MAVHRAKISWRLEGASFLKGQYSRAHTWSFDGGETVRASSSPSAVPPPGSDPTAVDPEEAYVAAIASCHMLTFLYLASRQGFQVERYEDDAEGMMARDEHGRTWVSAVKLRPKIVYGGSKQPTAADIAQLHHHAHEQCFIASSVKTAITVE